MRKYMLFTVFGICALLFCTWSGCTTGGGGDEGSDPVQPLEVDDFEDNDLVNAINSWMISYDPTTTTPSSMDTVDADVVHAPPACGDYLLQVLCEMQPDHTTQSGSDHYEFFFLHTGPTNTATPVDASSHGSLEFGLSFEGIISDGTADVYIVTRVYGGGSSISYDLLDGFASYSEYSIPLQDFTVSPGGTLEEVKSAVDQISFTVQIWGEESAVADYALQLDNLRFVE